MVSPLGGAFIAPVIVQMTSLSGLHDKPFGSVVVVVLVVVVVAGQEQVPCGPCGPVGPTRP